MLSNEELPSNDILKNMQGDSAYEYLNSNFVAIINGLRGNKYNEELANIFSNFYVQELIEDYLSDNDYSYDNIKPIHDYFYKDLRNVIFSQYDVENKVLKDNNYFDYIINNDTKVFCLFNDEDYDHEELLFIQISIFKCLKDKNFNEDIILQLFKDELYQLYILDDFYEYYELFEVELENDEESISKEYYEGLIREEKYIVMKILACINPTIMKYNVLKNVDIKMLKSLIYYNVSLHALDVINRDHVKKRKLTDKEVEESTITVVDNLEENYDFHIIDNYIYHYGTREIDLIISHDYNWFMKYYKQCEIHINFKNKIETFHFLEKDVLYFCLKEVLNTWTKKEIKNNKEKLIALFNETLYDMLINNNKELISLLETRNSN